LRELSQACFAAASVASFGFARNAVIAAFIAVADCTESS